MKLGCRIGWHDWENWELNSVKEITLSTDHLLLGTTQRNTGYALKTIQTRVCQSCNKTESDIKIKKLSFSSL